MCMAAFWLIVTRCDAAAARGFELASMWLLQPQCIQDAYVQVKCHRSLLATLSQPTIGCWLQIEQTAAAAASVE